VAEGGVLGPLGGGWWGGGGRPPRRRGPIPLRSGAVNNPSEEAPAIRLSQPQHRMTQHENCISKLHKKRMTW
jgi:hypothetical protein